MEKLKGEMEVKSSIIVYDPESNKQTRHEEEYNSLKDEDKVNCWFCNLQYKVLSI